MAFPPGPWVLIVGMHRSGTSAITGALGHLNVQLPELPDLMQSRRDNPSHYESHALTAVGDSMLKTLGRKWSTPSELSGTWLAQLSGDGLAERARAAAWTAFPHRGPVVWKDPRMCLLLPYWRRVLPDPLTAVLVWRSPLAVARSLRRRNHFPLSRGLALWYRHNVDALRALYGLRTLVVQYEEALENPVSICAEAGGWLDDCLGSTVPPRSSLVGKAAESISPALCHNGGTGALSGFYQDLVDLLTSLRGRHEKFETQALPQVGLSD